MVDWKVFKLFYIREPEGPDDSIPQFDDALRLVAGNKTSHESTVSNEFEVWKNWVENVDLLFFWFCQYGALTFIYGTQTIHVWYIYLQLPTFTIKNNQM